MGTPSLWGMSSFASFPLSGSLKHAIVLPIYSSLFLITKKGSVSLQVQPDAVCSQIGLCFSNGAQSVRFVYLNFLVQLLI